MANVSGGTISVALRLCEVRPDGQATIALSYATASGRVLSRNLTVPADRTKPITDDGGRAVTPSVPAGLGNAIDAFVTQLEGMITAGAGTGKLDL